jgi:hypothetical protein
MQHELMAPWIKGRGRFRFRWLVASVLAVFMPGCGAEDDTPPFSAGPDREPIGPKPFSDQGDMIGVGARVQSSRYVMDFVLGQSTQNQDQSTSASYLVRGGLIGVNGRAR